MSDYGRINPTELDNWITGHYGEDQFPRAEGRCSCGDVSRHRDGYGDIVASHCSACHITVQDGDPCACQEEDEDADPEDAS
jgi:hypothetical protein